MPSLETLRQPEHTGSNRCWPCTVVNLGLVALLSLVLFARERRGAGLLAAGIGLAAIVYRGYAVPYTPQFAPRLVAASPLPDEWFGKADPSVADGERESLTEPDLDGETVLSELVGAGVVVADGELVRPAEAVDTAWRREMDELRSSSPEELAATTRATLPDIDTVEPVESGGSEWLAIGRGHGEFVARPVAVAELAAYRSLADAVGDEGLRLAGARAFRMFLERCPVCDSRLELSSEVSCCGGYSDPQSSPDELLVCPDCEQRLYTFPSA